MTQFEAEFRLSLWTAGAKSSQCSRTRCSEVLSPGQVDEIVAIDLALKRLAAIDPRKSKVFEVRFFGGMTLEEASQALGVELER